ncbi:ACP S-malonyltransferase [Schleiferilactobacillus shenzhenensis]|uniref:Malonyl CoA-acyl carrier protein transacylase n=1 Tax=Schleiferilactobacillus shenzhenensis LY-73 TaxID=1231336 RepID=U4TGN6_9LACO|nr:ACP S-malonyltransferase [Schleiferilactobacillus shenzhenensis]ERL63941.1 [acyl-carrier-protein] S-malonyltransferase [Schleiferilactobacillus shenzhenensis LY-73]
MSRHWTALFSGQGQQFADMGRDLYAQEPLYRETVQQAAAATGIDLTATAAWNDPVNAPVAIVTLSLGVFRVLRQDMPLPQGAAGLSLGEYSALAASGMVTAKDVFPLVRDRAHYMDDAGAQHPGVMAAVLRCNATMVDEACAAATVSAGPVYPANYNTPSQTVIGGSPAGVAAAITQLKAQGVKRVVPLKMTMASHTPLMQPASDQLAQRLLGVPFTADAFPVWSNTTVTPFAPDTAAAVLTRQLITPTHFAACLQASQTAGPTALVELGPGSALTKFARQILPNMPAWHVDSVATLNDLRKNWSAFDE